MQLYRFNERTGRRQALTPDKDGDNLPEGWWDFKGTIDVNQEDGPRVGADSTELLDAIERDGVYIWPASDA